MNNLEQELIIFKKINGENKVIYNEHQNNMGGNSKKVALYNQGIGRAKLREFILREDVDYEFWKTL